MTRLHMSCRWHIYCILQTSHAYICLVSDTAFMSYRYHTPTYILSQKYQLCLTDITSLHMYCHRHSNCVLQTSHLYIYLVRDTEIVSYTHYTSTYFLSQTQQLCLTDITCLHMSCQRHISCVLQTSHAYIRYRLINCVLHTSHAYMSCHRHINCVLEKSHVYIWLFTDTSIVSNRHHTSTYVLSQTYQLCLTDITRLHMSCYRQVNCVLQTSHAYICLVIDKSIVSYRNHTSRYDLSQRHQWCLIDITRLHMSCHRHINCFLRTSHVYIYLVTDTATVSYRHHISTYILSQTQ